MSWTDGRLDAFDRLLASRRPAINLGEPAFPCLTVPSVQYVLRRSSEFGPMVHVDPAQKPLLAQNPHFLASPNH